jgi:hypothetical protein
MGTTDWTSKAQTVSRAFSPQPSLFGFGRTTTDRAKDRFLGPRTAGEGFECHRESIEKRNAALDAEYLFANNHGKWQALENLGEAPPHFNRVVMPEFLMEAVETIHLRKLLIPAQ